MYYEPLRISSSAVSLLLILSALVGISQADCPVAHTHIGRNPTWRPADWNNPGSDSIDTDPTDDNKLWFFALPSVHPSATPGWPDWTQTNGGPFLLLAPVLEGGQPVTKPGDPNKELFTCSFMYSKTGGYEDPSGMFHLDGWHSAHGPQGAWNLESTDASTVPAWDIYLKRERVSSNLDANDCFGLLPDDTPVLQSNGDTYSLEKHWLEDKGAWGIHAHMGFYFWLDESDEEVSVVVSAHDSGGVYERSTDWTIRFARRVCSPVHGDLNGDCVVDFADMAIMASHWANSGLHSGSQEEHDHDHSH